MNSGDKRVLDASVAVKWYVPEVGAAAAAAILNSDSTLLAPDLLVAEFGNILWKKQRAGELTSAEVDKIAHAFVKACPVTLVPSIPFLEQAVGVAGAFGRTVYDALYVVLAMAEDAVLLTADARLFHAVRGTPLGPFVALLAEP